MRRHGVQRRSLRFADAMDLEGFHTGFATYLSHPVTGGYGRWLNPLGRWDLGGRFDGRVIGSSSYGG